MLCVGNMPGMARTRRLACGRWRTIWLVGTARLSLESDSSEDPAQRTYTTKHGTQSTMDTAGQQDAAAMKKAEADAAAAAPAVTPTPSAAPDPVTHQVASAPAVAASLVMAAGMSSR